jgi:hypothetical protein
MSYYMYLCHTTCVYVILHLAMSYYMYLCLTTCIYVILHVPILYYMYLCHTTCIYVILHVSMSYYIYLCHATCIYVILHVSMSYYMCHISEGFTFTLLKSSISKISRVTEIQSHTRGCAVIQAVSRRSVTAEAGFENRSIYVRCLVGRVTLGNVLPSTSFPSALLQNKCSVDIHRTITKTI